MTLTTAPQITELENAPLPEGISYTIEEVTVEKANIYLSKNKDNRKPSKSWVQTLSMRLTGGEWLFTGDPIRFDSNGYLRDGQHRLKMVIESGIPITVPVIRGMDPNAFYVMDTGKKRELDTVLHINKYDHAAPLAAVIKDTWAYLYNQRSTGISHKTFIAFLEAHSELVDSVEFYQDKKGHSNVKLVGFGKPLTVAHYLLSRIDEDEAEAFMKGVMYGGDAITGTHLALRNSLITWNKKDSTRKNPSDGAALYVILQAWNDLHSTRADKRDKEQVRMPSADKLKPYRSIVPKGFPEELFLKPSPEQTVLATMTDAEQEEEN